MWAGVRSRAAIAHALAVVITLYGGLLRLDSFVGKYGTLDHPAWARIATRNIAPLVPAIRPQSVHWTHEPNPYVGGDPITYIQYGREMESFYQPHVREPVFLAMVHAGLWALDDQDFGVSLASAVGSMLAIFATYLVGAALFSPAAGLLAALLTATELEMVTWGVDGWRDDTFTATILFSVWALLRLRARPSLANALVAGALCGISCLTRITAITFVVPALLWLVIEHASTSRRERAKAVGIAAAMLTIVVAPYLVSCAIATGDPLLAINYHTSYYRFAEAQPIDTPMSAADYLRGKFVERPIRTLDTGLNGLFVQPFITKWHGFNEWMSGFGSLVRAISVVGLAALPFFPAGRLVLVALLGSLLPYIFTWNVGGGGAWRFTMHAYPFFFVAVGIAVVGAWRALSAIARHPAIVTRATLLRPRVAHGGHRRGRPSRSHAVLGAALVRDPRGDRPRRIDEHRDRRPRPHFLPARLVAPAPREHHGARVARSSRRRPPATARAPRLRYGAEDRSRHADGARTGRRTVQPPPRRAPPAYLEPRARRLLPPPPETGHRHRRQQRAHHRSGVRHARRVSRPEIRVARPGGAHRLVMPAQQFQA